MNYHKTVLPNGLKLITIPMPEVESVTAMVLVGAGSRFETPKTHGISHFLEHMTFKGTKKRPSAFAISSTIDAIGAEFNAYTSKEETVFYVKSAKKHLPLSVDVLADMVLSPNLDSKEIDRERGVIIEEENMYEDLPMRRVGEYFEKLLYPDSSLGWNIGGEKEIIKQIQREDFIEYRRRLYAPEKMIFVVSGAFQEADVMKLANDYLGKITGQGDGTEARESFIQKKPQLFLKTKKTDQTHLVVGVRGHAMDHPDRYTEAILAAILGGGMSSRLFIQVRERRGLAYYVRSETEHFVDNGYFATSAGVDTKKANEAVKVILEEYLKMKNKASLLPAELKKAKEFVKGRMILELEDSRNVAILYGTQELLENKIRTPEDIIKAVDKVRADDIARVATEFFTNDRLNMSIIGPFEDKSAFEKVLKL